MTTLALWVIAFTMIILTLKGMQFMSDLATRAAAAAERQTTITNSVVALLGTIVSTLKDVQTALTAEQADDSGLSDAITSIEGDQQRLADAVSANTPAEGAPEEPPVPEEPAPEEGPLVPEEPTE